MKDIKKLKEKTQKVGTFQKNSDVFVWKITSFTRKTWKTMSKLKKKLKEKTQNSRWKLKKSALLESLGAGKASKKSLIYLFKDEFLS